MEFRFALAAQVAASAPARRARIERILASHELTLERWELAWRLSRGQVPPVSEFPDSEIAALVDGGWIRAVGEEGWEYTPAGFTESTMLATQVLSALGRPVR